jgi:PPIC-type PPIASE domain
MKQLFVISFFLTTTLSFGQNLSQTLDNIKTLDDVEEFIRSNRSADAKIIYLNSDIDTLDFQKVMFKKNPGDILRIDDYLYKIISDTIINSYRASYIYLDGLKLSFTSIDSIRDLIITKYNSGLPFATLFNEYNMDGSQNDGDLDWFDEGMMVKEFERAIKEHKKNDIFKVDVPSNNWFYVVKKTYDDKMTKSIILIKVKSGS